jgi:hypothetical protein
MIANREKPRWSFYPEWVLLNALAVVVAAVIAWNLVSLITNIVGGTIQVNGQRRITEDFLLAYVSFPTIGLLTGLIQYALLHRYIPRLRWWIAATVLGWLLPFIVGLILTPIINSSRNTGLMWSIIGMPLMGATIGLPQWWILRTEVSRAYWWILAHVFGWWLIGLLNLLTSEPYAVLLAIALIPASATGIACWLLLGQLPGRAEQSYS